MTAPHALAGLRKVTPRPKLTAENVVEYIEWIMANSESLGAAVTSQHMAAAELVIRTLATAAQAKATQHTLVEDGTIAPPPAAS